MEEEKKIIFVILLWVIMEIAKIVFDMQVKTTVTFKLLLVTGLCWMWLWVEPEPHGVLDLLC